MSNAHAHVHSHSGGPPPKVGPVVRRRLIAALAPFFVATVIGLVVLWPTDEPEVGLPQGIQQEQIAGEVVAVVDGACPAPPGSEDFVCSAVTVDIKEGESEGESFDFNHSRGPLSRGMKVGDDVVVGRAPPGQPGPRYYFLDHDRKAPLLVLLAIFAVAVIALSRRHGFFSLIGVGVSLAVLIFFVMPAILAGTSPLLVSIVGAAAIMFVNLFLAHGVNARTATAILGTMISLALTGLLAVLFVNLARFTGFGSEEATFLQLSADQINLQGLLLGGIIIGTLGVLDDVTITQASAIWEIHVANPLLSMRDLYRSGIRIGRDHIASTVNTLVLAYAGASLPLLILFTISNRNWGDVLNSEVVAEEIVRTLVGSIGLVASVPLTTALGAAVVKANPERRHRPPRREREWRADEEDDGERDLWDPEERP